MTPADIRQARRRLALTQKGLADILGVVPNTVARWERGERTPPRYLERVLANLLPAVK